VRFRNGNPVPVTVYADSSRTRKIADIAANSSSGYLTNISYYSSTGTTQLYLRYHLFGAADFPYDYEFYNDVHITTVNDTSDTPAPVPLLSDLSETTRNEQLNKDGELVTYVVVHNNSSSSLILEYNKNTEVILTGSNSSALGSGKTGAYRVNAGNVSSYELKQDLSATLVWPDGLTEFQNGCIYSFGFSGSGLSWTALCDSSDNRPVSITINNALLYAGGFGVDDTGTAGDDDTPVNNDDGSVSLAHDTWYSASISAHWDKV